MRPALVMRGPEPTPAATAGVVALLVVSDDAPWLAATLDALEAQTLGAPPVLAVDNATSDGSATLLRERLPADRIIALDRRVGYGAAVAAARVEPAARAAQHLWLVHDDLVPASDALERLLARLDSDEGLGVVGPKVVGPGRPTPLLEVGLTVDRLGRLASPVEPDEIDQGQHDHRDAALAVSTAGMLVRRPLLDALDGFAPTHRLLREDLDLCWRARLAGWAVAVEPSAVATHLAATASGLRGLSPQRRRELGERHTLATVLACAPARRLLWTLPARAVLALLAAVGLVLLRRVGDALAVLRAWAWTAARLPQLLRRRRHIQRARARDPREVDDLIAPVLPRVRESVEAAGVWLAGDADDALVDPVPPPQPRRWRRVLRRPALLAGGALALAYLVAVAPLLTGGALRGGLMAPWPEPAALLSALRDPLAAAPLAEGSATAPATALWALLSVLAGGSAWLAERLLVLGALPLAWFTAWRAARGVSAGSAARAIGATVYVLTPAVLAGLWGGRIDLLAAAVLLPPVAAASLRLAVPERTRAVSLRTAGAQVAAVAVLGALAPGALPVVAAVAAVAVVSGVARGGGLRALRPLIGAVGVLPLLPWLTRGLTSGWTAFAPGVSDPTAGGATPLSGARALVAAPDLTGGPALWAAVVIAVVALGGGLLVGWRPRPLAAASLVVTLTAAAAAAVASTDPASPLSAASSGALLILVALCLAALTTLALAWAGPTLSVRAVGLPHLLGLLLAVAGGAGLLAAAWGLLGGPDRVAAAADPLPAFVRADAPEVGPYRILLVEGDAEGWRWDVVEHDGPSLASYGAVESPEATAAIEQAVALLAGGVDPRGAGLLGAANVRYVVATDPSDGGAPDTEGGGGDGGAESVDSDAAGTGDADTTVPAALDRQPGLEPLRAEDAGVWGVTGWLPRAAVVPDDVAERALTGQPGDVRAVAEHGLAARGPGRWAGSAQAGTLLLAEPGPPERWEASGEDGALPAREGIWGTAFVVGSEGAVEVSHHPPPTAAVGPVGLVVVLLGALSVAVHPPGARRRPAPAALPTPQRVPEPPAPRAHATPGGPPEEDQAAEEPAASAPVRGSP